MAEVAETTPAQMELADWLDDLTVRFLLNLPHDELSSMPRLCFQAEEAQWYYEDFVRPMNPKLPSLNLKQFCLTLFKHCPLFNTFSEAQHIAAYEEFLAYKVRVPVRGAILLDESLERILLVRGWKKGSSWSFPRGKINKDEKDIDCAIREVLEETGFDIRAAGLDKSNAKNGHVKAIDMVMKEQHLKMFVFRGVPQTYHFEPRTRKEIGDIQWYNVKDLPGNKKQKDASRNGQATKYYMVAPFIGPLKKWIHQQQKTGVGALHAGLGPGNTAAFGHTATHTEDEGYTEAEENERSARTPAIMPSNDLKRLLSIGFHSPSAPQMPQPQPFKPQGIDQGNDLLAMLQANQSSGATSLPQTGFEHSSQTLPQWSSETFQSRPSHQALPGSGPSYETPSHLPWGSQSMQQVQQYPQNLLGPGGHPSVALGPNVDQNLQTQYPWNDHSLRRPHQQSHSTPPGRQSTHLSQMPVQGGYSYAGDEGRADLPDRHAQQSTRNIRQHSSPDPHQQSLLNSLVSSGGDTGPLLAPIKFQAASLATDSGPQIPDASQLPAPQLNAHTRKLLDAFSTPGKKAMAPSSGIAASNGQRSGSQHQVALLGLLGKAPAAPAPQALATEQHDVDASTPPTPSGMTAKSQAPKAPERRPTLNEITRTLHPSFKSKPSVGPKPVIDAVSSKSPPLNEGLRKATSPPKATSSIVKLAPATVVGPTERPKSRGQLFDPKNPKKLVSAATNDSTDENSARHLTPLSPQRPPSRNTQPVKLSKGAKVEQSRGSNGPAAPQYSILQRSGSSTAATVPTPPAILSVSSDQSAAPAFQPQVLKRPNNSDIAASNAKELVTDDLPISVDSGNKSKDQLLALFGQTPALTSAATRSSAPTRQPKAGGTSNVHLNPLTTSSPPRLPLLKAPEPPPAPLLLPERKSPNQSQAAKNGAPSQQQQLLDLFTQRSPSAVASPNTPISPFTLGTPIARRPPPLHPPDYGQPRSRLGSYTSAVENRTPTGSSGQTPISTAPPATTPTETKGVLLGILNGVLEKEGHRGARKA